MSKRRRSRAGRSRSRPPPRPRGPEELANQAELALNAYYATRYPPLLDVAIDAYERLERSKVPIEVREYANLILAELQVVRHGEDEDIADLDDAIRRGELALASRSSHDSILIKGVLAAAHALRFRVRSEPRDRDRMMQLARSNGVIEWLNGRLPFEGVGIFFIASLTILEHSVHDPLLEPANLRRLEYEYAVALRLLFEVRGRHGDILSAGEFADKARQPPAAGDRLALALLELGTINCIKFEISEQVEFLNESIGLLEEGLSQCEVDSTKGLCYAELATVLQFKYHESQDPEILDYRSYCLNEALELAADDHRPGIQVMVAQDMLVTAGAEAANEAIDLVKQAIQGIDPHSRYYLPAIQVHALALFARDEDGDLDAAIDMLTGAADTEQHITELQPLAHANLAQMLKHQAARSESSDQLVAASRLIDVAIESGWLPAVSAVEELLSRARELAGNAAPAEVTAAARDAIDYYTKSIRPFLMIGDEQSLHRQSELVMTEAVAVLAEIGEWEASLECLDQLTGAARYFDRRLSLLDKLLEGVDDPAARALSDARRVYLAARNELLLVDSLELSSLDSVHMRFDELKNAIEGVSKLGFTLDVEGQRTPEPGEVMLSVLTGTSATYVLVEGALGVWGVTLPIDEAEVAQYVDLFGLSMRVQDGSHRPYWPDGPADDQERVLNWLWVSLIKPLVEAAPASTPLFSIPRWSWLVIGGLSRLPLHAALDPETGTCLLDLVAPCRRELARLPPPPASLKLPTRLSVFAEGEPVGLPSLESVPKEIQILQSLSATFGTVDVRAANRNEFLTALDEPGLVHATCHGVIHPFDPGRSGLALNEFVSLLDIVSASSVTAPEMVFLSACSTSLDTSVRGYEPLAISSTLLASGATWVVGALWSLLDTDSVSLTEVFYAALAATGDPTHATRAAAVALRERYPDSPARWASLVCTYGISTLRPDVRSTPPIPP